uniref:Uncharacterized protein n=1 Tax=Rhizophora mucronata TaxID=61149 RepID=A0A2P2P1V0_RHIMU
MGLASCSIQVSLYHMLVRPDMCQRCVRSIKD